MDLRLSERERLDADPNAYFKIRALAQYGSSGVLMHEGMILAVFGYVELWPGAYEVWAFPSVHVETYPMIYLRTMKRYIRMLEKSHKPHRLQTSSMKDELHDRWMRFLGFECETPDGMKNYSVLKQTFNLWAKTYEEADHGV